MTSRCCTGVMTASVPFDIPTSSPFRKAPFTAPAEPSEAAIVPCTDTSAARPLHTNIMPITANARANVLVQYKSRPGYLRLAPQDRDEVLMAIIQTIASNSPCPKDTTAIGALSAAAAVATAAMAGPMVTAAAIAALAALAEPLRPELLAEDVWPAAFSSSKGARSGRRSLQLQLNAALFVTPEEGRLEGLKPLMMSWGVRNNQMLLLTLRLDGRLLLSRPPDAKPTTTQSHAPDLSGTTSSEVVAAAVAAAASATATLRPATPLQPTEATELLCHRRGAVRQLPDDTLDANAFGAGAGAGADGGAATHLARSVVDAVATEGSDGDGGATGAAASIIADEASGRGAPASDRGHGGGAVASGADLATDDAPRVSPAVASAPASAAVAKPECVAGDYQPPASLAPEPQPRTSVQSKGMAMEAVEMAVAKDKPYEEAEAAAFSFSEGMGEDSVLVEVGASPPPPPPSSAASAEAATRGSCSLGAALKAPSLPLLQRKRSLVMGDLEGREGLAMDPRVSGAHDVILEGEEGAMMMELTHLSRSRPSLSSLELPATAAGGTSPPVAQRQQQVVVRLPESADRPVMMESGGMGMREVDEDLLSFRPREHYKQLPASTSLQVGALPQSQGMVSERRPPLWTPRQEPEQEPQPPQGRAASREGCRGSVGLVDVSPSQSPPANAAIDPEEEEEEEGKEFATRESEQAMLAGKAGAILTKPSAPSQSSPAAEEMLSLLVLEAAPPPLETAATAAVTQLLEAPEGAVLDTRILVPEQVFLEAMAVRHGSLLAASSSSLPPPVIGRTAAAAAESRAASAAVEVEALVDETPGGCSPGKVINAAGVEREVRLGGREPSQSTNVTSIQQPLCQHYSALPPPPPFLPPPPAPREAEESKDADGRYSSIHVGTGSDIMASETQLATLDTVAVPPDVIPYDEDMRMMLDEETIPWMIAKAAAPPPPPPEHLAVSAALLALPPPHHPLAPPALRFTLQDDGHLGAQLPAEANTTTGAAAQTTHWHMEFQRPDSYDASFAATATTSNATAKCERGSRAGCRGHGRGRGRARGRGRTRGVKRRLTPDNDLGAPDFHSIDDGGGGGGGGDDKDKDWVPPSGSGMWEVEPCRSRSGRPIHRVRISPLEAAAAPPCAPPSPEERTSVLGRHLPKGNKWRKYGEKVIEGLRRSYFRCSVPGCPARLRAEWRPWGGGGGMSAGEAKQALWISLEGGDHEHDPNLPLYERRRKVDGVAEWKMVQPEVTDRDRGQDPSSLALPLPAPVPEPDPINEQGQSQSQNQHQVQIEIPADPTHQPSQHPKPELTGHVEGVEQPTGPLPPQQQWRQREEWELREEGSEGEGGRGKESGVGLTGRRESGDTACGLGDKVMCFAGGAMSHQGAETTVDLAEYVYGAGGIEHHGLHEPMLYDDVGASILYDDVGDAASEDAIYAHWEADLDAAAQMYGGGVVAAGLVGGPVAEGLMVMPVMATAAAAGGVLEGAAVGPTGGGALWPQECPVAGVPRFVVAEPPNPHQHHFGANPPSHGDLIGGCGGHGDGNGEGGVGGRVMVGGGGGGGVNDPIRGAHRIYAGSHYEQFNTLGAILGPMGWSWDMDTGELPPLSLPLSMPRLPPPPPPPLPPPPQSLPLPRLLLSPPPSLDLRRNFMPYSNDDIQMGNDLITSDGHLPSHFVREHGTWLDRTAGGTTAAGGPVTGICGGMLVLGRGSEGSCWNVGDFWDGPMRAED